MPLSAAEHAAVERETKNIRNSAARAQRPSMPAKAGGQGAPLALELAYARVPAIACRGRYQDICGPVPITRAEWARIAARLGTDAPPVEHLPGFGGDVVLPCVGVDLTLPAARSRHRRLHHLRRSTADLPAVGRHPGHALRARLHARGARAPAVRRRGRRAAAPGGRTPAHAHTILTP
mgnify:CR=1 FL=1